MRPAHPTCQSDRPIPQSNTQPALTPLNIDFIQGKPRAFKLNMTCTMSEPQTATYSSRPLRILVGDDQPWVLEALRLLLKSAGHQAVTAESPESVLALSGSAQFDLILIDLNYARDTTSGQEGLDLLRRLQASGNNAPIVVMTAWGNIDLAVEAMRRGASDFVQKPWDNARLIDTIEKQSRRRAQSDMDLARHVQQNLFPRPPEPLNTLEVAGTCLPAREVGGDYYDYLNLSASRRAFVLADVSGKGMASALLMANLQASFRSQSGLAERDPIALITSVNELFFESSPPEHYATLFYAEYDDRSRQLSYINCGHPSGIIVRADRSVERLEATATVVGMFKSWNGTLGKTHLKAGDLVVLCSDGVVEAGIESGEEYGEDRLVSAIQGAHREQPARVVDRLLASLQAFHAGPQHDDITLIVLRASV